jgi:hypothetical protein
VACDVDPECRVANPRVATIPCPSSNPADDRVIDTERQYAIADVVERYVIRPAIFRSFGWEVEQVLGKDLVLREQL